MHPELFRLPIFGGMTIKTYGFCLMLGFLSAVWLAMRRARRVKASPDRVLDLSFVTLLFGVGGARLFFVLHRWSSYAAADNTLMAVLDIREGGLEFLGGVIGAAIAIVGYLLWTRQSIRLYIDILTPSLMWGLAIGRIGCFFNGCCFGAVCVTPGADQVAPAWAVQFPYGSPAHVRQWEERDVSVPAELITQAGALFPTLVPASALSMSPEQREGPVQKVRDLEQKLDRAKVADPNSDAVKKFTGDLEAARRQLQTFRKKAYLDLLERAQRYPSREHPTRRSSVSELQALASTCRSLPVHPTQLYSTVNGFLLFAVASAVFYRRKRHGVVAGLMLMLYPITRFILESIRVDNPHDAAGLTISQFISVGLFLAGGVYLLILFKFMPERSPLADVVETPRDVARGQS